MTKLFNFLPSKDLIKKDFIPYLAALMLFLLLSLRVFYFFLSSDDVLIGVIPDDAFYYLQMAKHRLNKGFWTFDGEHVSTGFHLLYGYLLYGIYFIFGEIDFKIFYLAISVIASIAISLAFLLTLKFVKRVYGEPFYLASALPFLTMPLVLQSTAMMESWLILYISAHSIYLTLSKRVIWENLFLFALGISGSLARSDFGAMPLFLCIATYFFSKNRNVIYGSCILLVGSIFGLLVDIAHIYFSSGHFFQTSAQVKEYWSFLAGHSVLNILMLLETMLYPSFIGYLVDEKIKIYVIGISILLLSFAVIKLLINKKVERSTIRSSNLGASLYIFSVVTILFYSFFYRHNSQALQVWYCSNLLIPLAICVAGSFKVLLGKISYFKIRVLVGLYFINAASCIFFIPYEHQAAFLEAGKNLGKMNDGRYAAWNAGIVGFFSGGSVINLDGLVNDEVFPFIKNNKLLDYIEINNIKYIVDFEIMLESSFRMKGGYDDDRVDRCIIPIATINNPSNNWAGRRLMQYEINKCD